MKNKNHAGILILLSAVVSAIILKEDFPNIEIHSKELQIFSLSDYFLGENLQFSVRGEGTHISFESNRKVCSVTFNSPAKTAFLLDPDTELTPQRFFLLHSNFSLGIFEMNNACTPDITTIDIVEKVSHKNYTLIDASTLYAYYEGRTIICTVNSVLEFKKNKEENIIILSIRDSEVGLQIQPLGDFANSTSLEHEDMMVVYFRCTERGKCAEHRSQEYAIYIYLMRGQKLQEYAPFLVTKMEANFFGKVSIAINSIVSSYEGILISDIENNVVYRVEISRSTRIPELVAEYAFPTRIDSISVLPYFEDHFFLSPRLGQEKNGIIYSLIRHTLLQIFGDLHEKKSKESIVILDSTTFVT